MIFKMWAKYTMTCHSIICCGISSITRTGIGSNSVVTILCTIVSACRTFIHIWRIEYSIFTCSISIIKALTLPSPITTIVENLFWPKMSPLVNNNQLNCSKMLKFKHFYLSPPLRTFVNIRWQNVLDNR